MATFGQINAENITSSTGGVISPNITSLRNRIINGAMVIDQRNNGAAVSVATADVLKYITDRFAVIRYIGTSVVQAQQTTTVPSSSNFSNSLEVSVTTSSSTGSTDQTFISQKIEGYNTADLKWGYSNAQSITLSFWVQSSLTGTFGIVFRNSASNRAYPTTYTISSANTWTQISITIAGDTAGTWLTTNGIGIEVIWDLGVGSSYSATAGSWTSTSNISGVTGVVKLTTTNAATFYITGVQLEVGAQATSFDYRPYGTELFLCQRYYFRALDSSNQGEGACGSFVTNGAYTSTGKIYGSVPLPVSMRGNPSVTYSGVFANSVSGSSGSFSSVSSSTGAGNCVYLVMNFNIGTSGTANQFAWIDAGNTAGTYLAFSAEL